MNRNGIGTRRLAGLSAVVCAGVICSGAACLQRVKVPPAGQDQAPAIVLNNLLLGPGTIDRDTVNSDTTVNVSPGARVQFTGSARNPSGGVKEFSISVQLTPPQVARTTQSPDASGQVSDNLGILGTDGSGGAGSQPLAITFSEGLSLTVVATATNFNGQTSSVTETLVAKGNSGVVPNVVGKKVWEAREALAAAGFSPVCGTCAFQDAAVKSQNPPASSKAPLRSTVTIEAP